MLFRVCFCVLLCVFLITFHHLSHHFPSPLPSLSITSPITCNAAPVIPPQPSVKNNPAPPPPPSSSRKPPSSNLPSKSFSKSSSSLHTPNHSSLHPFPTSLSTSSTVLHNINGAPQPKPAPPLPPQVRTPIFRCVFCFIYFDFNLFLFFLFIFLFFIYLFKKVILFYFAKNYI